MIPETRSQTILEQTYDWLLSISGQLATECLKSTIIEKKEQFLQQLQMNDLHFLSSQSFKTNYEWELFFKIQNVLRLFDLRLEEVCRCDFNFANMKDRQEERLREKAERLGL